MDFFDRYKALIVTSLLFAVIILTLYNFNLANNNQATAEMMVDLEQFKVEEKEAPEPEKTEEVPQRNPRDVQTHKAYNQDKETRDADFNSKLDEIFEKNSAEQDDAENQNTNGSNGNYAVNKKNAEEKKKRSDGATTNKEASQKSATYDYSSISFSLKDRRAVKIPNPVYTCDQAGKIVVNISVNESGYVIDSAINKGSSTSTNECLTSLIIKI